MRIQDIVERVTNSILATHGDLSHEIEKPVAIHEATKGTITFCNLEGEELRNTLEKSLASAIVCKPIDTYQNIDATLITTDKPRSLFIDLMRLFFLEKAPSGTHPSAVIDPSTSIGKDVFIGANVTIGKNCHIGDGTILHPNVCLYDNTTIGAKVTVNANTVIGAPGFGYERNADGEMIHFPHIGGVLIENNVEIGSNVSIDRGTLGNTTLKKGAKIDNLVHIAHNVIVGEDSCVIALSMIGGSTRLGDRSWISPSACLRDGLQIGNEAMIGLGAVVVKDVVPQSVVMGAPARPASEFKKQLKILNQLLKDET